MTSDSLTGSGSAYLPTGGPTTAYGDMLNSLTPSSANYTVSLTCTPVTTTGSVAVFARASSGANTNYAFTVGLEHLQQVRFIARWREQRHKLAVSILAAHLGRGM
jgi:hypothetical protein